MAIVGFFAGKRIIQASETKSEKLPSPHQVSLLVGLLDGGSAGSLIDTILYRWSHHEKLVQPIASLPLILICVSGLRLSKNGGVSAPAAIFFLLCSP